MLVANHYVKVNGVVYMRGECVPDDITPIKLDWLLSVGAVSRTDETEDDGHTEESEEEPEEEEKPEIGMPKPEEPERSEQAPEIDAIAGIVKPKRRRGGKRSEG